MTGIAQSVEWPATWWTVPGSNSGGDKFFRSRQTILKPHQAALTVGSGSLPGVKRPGLVLNIHLLLVLRVRNFRAIYPPSCSACLGMQLVNLYLQHIKSDVTTIFKSYTGCSCSFKLLHRTSNFHAFLVYLGSRRLQKVSQNIWKQIQEKCLNIIYYSCLALLVFPADWE